MEGIKFGVENRELSKIVLGLMRIDKFSIKEGIQLLETAYESGINMIDLADIYGGGVCEEIIGNVFKEKPYLRDKFYVQSKCGIRHDCETKWYDNSASYLKESVDKALQRLNTDHIDCYLLHRPDVLMDASETAEAMKELKSSGKVIDFGVSNHNVQQIKRLQDNLDFKLATNQVQLSCAFTPMIDSGIHVNMKDDAGIMRQDGILEYCQRKDITVQTWSSLQHGFIQGTFLGNPGYERLNGVLNEIAMETSSSPMAVAIAWLLKIPGKIQAIVGTTKCDRIREVAKANEISLTRPQWYRIYLAVEGNYLP